MKDTTKKTLIQRGVTIGNVQGVNVTCLATFWVGGSDHRKAMVDLFDGLALDAPSQLRVTADPGKKMQVGIAILPTDILFVRSSGRTGHTNPFHLDFPSAWASQWLPPQYGISHLPLGAWCDIRRSIHRRGLLPKFVDVHCGAVELEHEKPSDLPGEALGDTPRHTTLLQFKQGVNCGGVVLEPDTRCSNPLIITGHVAFSLYKIG